MSIKPLVSTASKSVNEQATRYSHGGASHIVRIISQISPELLMLHQVQVAAFLRKTNATASLGPVAREVRDVMYHDISR